MARQATRIPEQTFDTTAEKILRAASKLMGDHGFDGTSAQAIADRASVNKALVFYHFGNKAKLFERVLEHLLEGMVGALEEAVDTVDPNATIEAALHHVLDAYIDYVERNPAYPRLIQQELAHKKGRHDLIGSYNVKNFNVIEKLLSPMKANNPLFAPDQLFVSIGGMVQHYFVSTPVLAPVLSRDKPMSTEALAARRAHVHWVVDAMIAAMQPAN